MNFELNGRYLTAAQRKIVGELDKLIDLHDVDGIKLFERDYKELLKAVPAKFGKITLKYKGVSIEQN